MEVGLSFSIAVAFSLVSHCYAQSYYTEPQVDGQFVIYVSSSCSQGVSFDTIPGSGNNCTDLDDALDELSNGVTILMEPGIHSINRPHHFDIRGASNIKIMGAGADLTVITCADQNGLSFVGITNLTLENFTMTHCGLSGSNMEYHVSLLRELLDLWFFIPPTSKIALFVGHCTNVMIQDVNITRTAGLGFLGINILGKSVIQRSGFTANIRPKCFNKRPPIVPSLFNPDDFDQVGGGAFILFTDVYNVSNIEAEVKLGLSELYFAHNADCTFAANTIMNFPYFSSHQRNIYNYSIGAGGGLSIILSNSDFPVEVCVSETIFYHNEARYGSGAFVATFAGFQEHLSVSFFGCSFIENGLASTYDGRDQNQIHSHCKGGAGLAIFTDLLKPSHFQKSIPTSSVQFVFEMKTAEFVSNEAQVEGGGIFAYSLLTTPQQVSDVNNVRRFYLIAWVLVDINFTNNCALYGSAGFFDQTSDFSFSGSVLLGLANVTARNNHNLVRSSNPLDNTDDASTIHIKKIVGALGDITLENNTGSAMHLESTLITVQANATLIFRGNSAHRGGALHLSGHSPVLIVHENNLLLFEGNSAVTEGGAIYYSLPGLSDDVLEPFSFRGCILLTEEYSSPHLSDSFGIFESGIKLVFKKNYAPLGGTIFGPAFQSCLWATNLTSVSGENISIYSKLYGYYNSTFSFDHDPIRDGSFNSLPASISVTTSTEQPLQAFPGQDIPIKIKVMDSFNNTIPAVVTSAVNGLNVKSTLGESGFWYTDVANTTLSVGSAQSGSVSVSVLTSGSSVSTSVSVDLLSCPAGFELNPKSLRCSCSGHFRNHSEVTCNMSSISFRVLDSFWIGFDPSIKEPTSDNLTLSRCVFDYCRNGTKDVLPTQIDSQCNYYRMGILCGSCNRGEGYSSVFGTSECHKCSNYMLFLIIAFAIAGAILFSGIFFLEITIDKGWTNSIIFFCSVVSIYDYVIPVEVNYRYGFIPARLLNLQIGVSLCFYDGMTALSRTGLQLAFPTYLYVLMLVFAILCRRFSWMSTHFSPAKTLMTLSVMCYTSVLTTCVELIGLVKITTFDGMHTSYRWSNDPNQVYFQGLHGFLCAIGIVIVLIYIIPFPIVLLFPSLAYKYLVKFTPLFDALWAAYKPKYRFWLGLRLLSVAFLFISTRFPDGYGITFGGIFALIFFQIQGFLHPFKGKLANLTETYFLTIVLLFYWGSLAIIAFTVTYRVRIIAGVYVSLLTTTSYIIMILLFIHHIHHKFPQLWVKLHAHLIHCCKRFCSMIKGQDKTTLGTTTVETESGESLGSDQSGPGYVLATSVYINRQQSRSSRNNEWNRRFRESLLGSVV